MSITKKTNRFRALLLAVVMLFSLVLNVYAETDPYPPYEFVVTSDKTSVIAGDTVMLTVTVNGPMNNASMLQYSIFYLADEFKSPYDEYNEELDYAELTAFEEEWFWYVEGGDGLGAIALPMCGDKSDPVDSSKRIFSVSFFDSTGQKFVNSKSDLYEKNTTVVGKIYFTALKDIEDISSCFVINNAKHNYGKKKQTLKAIGADETILVQLSETIAIQNKAEAAKVEALIIAIGTVTLDSEDEIIDAEKAWEALTKAQQSYVSNHDVLVKARQDYNTLVSNRALAEDIERLITSSVPAAGGITNEIAEAVRIVIAKARSEYDEATDEVKKLVDADVYKWLTDAETALENVDKAEAAKVDALIDAIGTVTLESQWDILNAQNAYNALSDAQKKHVEKYDVLEKAVKDYNEILSNREAAIELEDSIKELSELGAIDRSNAETARGKIDSVRASYGAVSETIQNYVSKDVYQILLDAETEIALVEAAIAEAKAVEDLIDGIGEITLDSVEASDGKLAEIANKLETISDRAKGYIYPDKMTAYTEACSALEDCKSKLARVQAVIDKITALGNVDDITLDHEEAVIDAEADYEALAEDLELQNRVTNSKTLLAIRAKLNALIKSEADVNNVIELIDEIGEVTLNSSAKISAARGAYDKLTEDEQARVDNYTVLTEAEDLYAKLFAASEQEKADRAAADGVEELIDAIGEVVLTDKCEALIKAAEDAYAVLTDHQKTLVENYSVLIQARANYNALKADKEAVDAVIKAINDIGTVTYDEDCLTRIQAAEAAYKKLDDDLKKLVTNSDKIEFSKNKYAQLEAEDMAVKNAISLIDAIGEVSWTEDSLNKINAAREAYDALKRDDLKAKVENADVLIEAEKTYTSLKPVFDQETEIAGYNGNHMTVITNVPENMIASDGTVDAVVIKLGDNVYHVFVTDHEVSEANIVLRHGTPEVHEIGDVKRNGSITANDAQLACQYAARTEEAIKEFANDPLAFVRADVNGTGTITALDALMIARKFMAPNEVIFNLLVGMLKN